MLFLYWPSPSNPLLQLLQAKKEEILRKTERGEIPAVWAVLADGWWGGGDQLRRQQKNVALLYQVHYRNLQGRTSAQPQLFLSFFPQDCSGQRNGYQIISMAIFVYQLIEVGRGRRVLGWEYQFMCDSGAHGYTVCTLYSHCLTVSLHRPPTRSKWIEQIRHK